MKIKFDKRPKYIGHLALIVLTLFASYYLGNYLIDFSNKYGLIIMFLWFLIVLYISDNILEGVLKV